MKKVAAAVLVIFVCGLAAFFFAPKPKPSEVPRAGQADIVVDVAFAKPEPAATQEVTIPPVVFTELDADITGIEAGQVFMTPEVRILENGDGKKTSTPSPVVASAPVSAPAIPGECTVGTKFPDAIRQWCAFIEVHARENGLDPNLVAAVMLEESGGNPQAYSVDGAVGLIQVMPSDGIAASFQCPAGPCFAKRPTMAQLFDPEFNISYGSAMLGGLIQKYGSIREGLYRYGPSGIGYDYADIVITIMENYS